MEPPVVDYVFEKEKASWPQILIEELASVLATRVRLNDELGLEPEWTKFRSVSPPAITIQAYLQRYDQHQTVKFSHFSTINNCTLGEGVPIPCCGVILVALTSSQLTRQDCEVYAVQPRLLSPGCDIY
jgi:hypothetical protein